MPRKRRARSVSPARRVSATTGVPGGNFLEGELTASVSALEGLREKMDAGRPRAERKFENVLGNPFQVPLNYWERKERRRAERKAAKARLATCKGIYAQRIPRRVPLPQELLAVMNKQWTTEGTEGDDDGESEGEVEWDEGDVQGA